MSSSERAALHEKRCAEILSSLSALMQFLGGEISEYQLHHDLINKAVLRKHRASEEDASAEIVRGLVGKDLASWGFLLEQAWSLHREAVLTIAEVEALENLMIARCGPQPLESVDDTPQGRHQ